MRLLSCPLLGSARHSIVLALICLALATVSDAVALNTTDTTHTGVGSLVIRLRTGELYSTCSGTLIGPDVFLTAGHCTRETKRLLEVGTILDIFVSFDTQITQSSTLVNVVDLVTHPGFVGIFRNRMDYINDIGVVLLATPDFDRPLASLPTEGLLDLLQLAPGTVVTSVGYGRDSYDIHGSPPYPVYTGTRSSGSLSFRALTPDFVMVTTLANQGDDNPCYGDSGGPNFLSVDDEEQLVAVTSINNSYSCEEVHWMIRLDTPGAREFLAAYVNLP